MRKRYSPLGVACMLVVGSCSVYAVSPEQFRGCAEIKDDRDRLSCYDKFAGRHADYPLIQHEALSPALTLVAGKENVGGRIAGGSFMLSRHWELEPYDERGIFNFRLHR